MSEIKKKTNVILDDRFRQMILTWFLFVCFSQAESSTWTLTNLILIKLNGGADELNLVFFLGGGGGGGGGYLIDLENYRIFSVTRTKTVKRIFYDISLRCLT